jgi:hypothetical protein
LELVPSGFPVFLKENRQLTAKPPLEPSCEGASRMTLVEFYRE